MPHIVQDSEEGHNGVLEERKAADEAYKAKLVHRRNSIETVPIGKMTDATKEVVHTAFEKVKRTLSRDNSKDSE